MEINKNRDILDSEHLGPVSNFNPNHEVIRWWERKRLIYNVLLFSVEILIMISYKEGLKRFGYGDAIFQTIAVNIVANAFYSMGWGLEIFLNYYIPGLKFKNPIKWTLFIVGILFSLLLAALAYESALALSYIETGF